MSGLSLPCLVLTLLLEIRGSRAQGFQLLQPQDAESVAVGETLTLNCSVTGDPPVGPVRWFKDSGPGRQLVYDDKGSFPRVTRAVPGSATDFTIRIRDTRPADAGVYHCVKFKKGTGPDEEIRSGAGTTVSVIDQSGFSSYALWIGLFLEKAVMATFLLFLFLFLRSKG